jgi:hypothetical protein
MNKLAVGSLSLEESPMHTHRFREQAEALVSSRDATKPIVYAGFVACPLGLVAAMTGGLCGMQQQVYEWAFQQAQAVVRPSRLERAFAFSEN